MNKYNTLDAIVKMAKDDNQGIIMSNTVTEVRTDARGYIIGFGVEKKRVCGIRNPTINRVT